MLSRILIKIEDVEKILGAAAMLLIMSIILADVVSRYLFNLPFSWAYELISIFLIPIMFFLPLGYVQRMQGNIAVDLAIQHAPPWLRSLAFRISAVSGVIIYGFITWIFLGKSLTAYLKGDVLIGPIVWIVWPMYLIVAIGVGLLVLRLALQIFQGENAATLVASDKEVRP